MTITRECSYCGLEHSFELSEKVTAECDCGARFTAHFIEFWTPPVKKEREGK